MRKGKDDKTTEAQYAEINEKVANNRIAADQLLIKLYLGKFKKDFFQARRFFSVQRAEMRFHREMIKGMNRSKDKGDDSKKSKGKKTERPDSVRTDALFEKMEALSSGNRASVFYAGKEVTVLFSFASFQMASISSRDISFRLFPSFDGVLFQIIETADKLLVGKF